MWQWNTDGPREMHGWVFTWGIWAWGCAITWHVVDILDDVDEVNWFWVGYFWLWSEGAHCWMVEQA
eukprot:570225-Karenia_brevis.AAC.1